MSSPVGIKLVLNVKVLDTLQKKIRIDFKRTLFDSKTGHEFKPEELHTLIGHADQVVKGVTGREWILENVVNPFVKHPHIGNVNLYEEHEQEYKFDDERDIDTFRLFWEFLVKLKGFYQI